MSTEIHEHRDVNRRLTALKIRGHDIRHFIRLDECHPAYVETQLAHADARAPNHLLSQLTNAPRYLPHSSAVSFWFRRPQIIPEISSSSCLANI
jgi:hypothetical protein